ncbi:hypothetical protein [uncultured Psychrosphaera sp.]|uniref:hypothetical protein n=1 Tax=uncultured Psychrosphaera sp. TaxID=1403522 RepID=UPI00262BD71B|nr:hypothetical protein [uncultured Psychrosphaera sp.]
MSSNWKNTLAAIAPTLAAAIGGPLAGGAVRFLSGKLLGEDATIKDLENFVTNASPEQLADVKRSDNEFKLEMERVGVDIFALEVKGRENARLSHKDHPMPMVICLLLTVMVAIGGYGLMTITVPKENANIVFMLFGQVVTAWGSSIAYWVGTTKSSSDKNKIMKAVQ